MESALSRIQPPELKSAVGWSQLEIVSSAKNSSQPWDRVSRSSYPAAGTPVSREKESAATRIQPPELQSAVGRNQPYFVSRCWNSRYLQLVSSRRNASQPQLVLSCVSETDIFVGILDFNMYNYVYLFAFNNF